MPDHKVRLEYYSPGSVSWRQNGGQARNHVCPGVRPWYRIILIISETDTV